MKAAIGHIGINLSNSNESFKFWKELLGYLGFKVIPDGDDHFDAIDGRSYLCVSVTDSKYKKNSFHRKQTGLNHIALRVDSAEYVDEFVQGFLEPHNIKPLYGGAKAYPEYVDGYYAVYFEDPDRIKIEVVCDPTD
ncbi:VOC family protein [Candidatus Saccharibacteria bacterium]|nr:VOC family protein [Candidatus Saccharibacteria bacterium]